MLAFRNTTFFLFWLVLILSFPVSAQIQLPKGEVKEIEAIKNAPNNANGEQAAGEAGAATETGRGAVDNRNMQKPAAGGKTPKGEFD